MTNEEIINEIRCLLSELDNGEDAVSYLTQNDIKWLNENIKALEQEPSKPMVAIDLYSVIKQSYIEREALDKIKAEIDYQQKWLLHAGYTIHNVDLALDTIKSVVAEIKESK